MRLVAKNEEQIDGQVCETSYWLGDECVGYWAYGNWDPAYPYKGQSNFLGEFENKVLISQNMQEGSLVKIENINIIPVNLICNAIGADLAYFYIESKDYNLETRIVEVNMKFECNTIGLPHPCLENNTVINKPHIIEVYRLSHGILGNDIHVKIYNRF